jgi:hypothetical protein
MTDDIRALLEELREIDIETWKDVRFHLINIFSVNDLGDINLRSPLLQNAYSDIIQGCIQRACEHQKWIWHYGHGPEMGYVATVNHGNIIKGETSAAAILVAYVQAKRTVR